MFLAWCTFAPAVFGARMTQVPETVSETISTEADLLQQTEEIAHISTNSWKEFSDDMVAACIKEYEAAFKDLLRKASSDASLCQLCKAHGNSEKEFKENLGKSYKNYMQALPEAGELDIDCLPAICEQLEPEEVGPDNPTLTGKTAPKGSCAVKFTWKGATKKGSESITKGSESAKSMAAITGVPSTHSNYESDSGTAGNVSLMEDESAPFRFRRKCPKLYQTPSVIPNVIHIKIGGATNLPYAYSDTVDPYVRFWIGPPGKLNGIINWKDHEKKWLANTAYINNNRDPTYNFGCTFFYGTGGAGSAGDASDDDSSKGDDVVEDDVLHVVVMDRNTVASDAFVGRIGVDGSDGVSIPAILKHDTRVDGEFEVTFTLYDKKGKAIKGRDQKSKITLSFQVMHDPSKYMLKKSKAKDVPQGVGQIE